MTESETQWGLSAIEVGPAGDWIALLGTGTQVRLTRLDTAGSGTDMRLEYRQEADFASHSYRAKVRELALRTADVEGWCQPGVNLALRQLGLPIATKRWNFTALITVKTYRPDPPWEFRDRKDDIAEALGSIWDEGDAQLKGHKLFTESLEFPADANEVRFQYHRQKAGMGFVPKDDAVQAWSDSLLSYDIKHLPALRDVAPVAMHAEQMTLEPNYDDSDDED